MRFMDKEEYQEWLAYLIEIQNMSDDNLKDELKSYLVTIKELLGHSCIRSTMTYVHVANNMQKVDSPLDIFLRKGDKK